LAFGLLGFVYVGAVVAIVVKRAGPDWFIGSLEPYLASSVISSRFMSCWVPAFSDYPSGSRVHLEARGRGIAAKLN